MYLPALFISFLAALAIILLLVAESYAREARCTRASQIAYNRRGYAARRQTRTAEPVVILSHAEGF